MGSRFGLLVVASLAACWTLPVTAAQFEKTGNWVFDSKAVAADGDTMFYACAASTESAEGTELVLSVEPAAEAGVDARLTLTNGAWAFEDGPVRVRFDIGADHWVLPGQAQGPSVDVSWTGDAAFLTFIEDLASSSFAGVTGRDGTSVAQFSLKGSRAAIEAMKACAREQIGKDLGAALSVGSGAGDTPF